MGKGPVDFKEANVRRAIKAAREEGLDIAAVRIAKNGTIDIITGKPVKPNGSSNANEWDEI
jgi:hypothetical protein